MGSLAKARLIVFLFMLTTVLHIVLLKKVQSVSATTQGVIASVIITLLVWVAHQVVVDSTEQLNRWLKGWIIWSAKCRLVWFFTTFVVHLWAVFYSTPKRSVETGGALFVIALICVVQGWRDVRKATNDKQQAIEYLTAFGVNG